MSIKIKVKYIPQYEKLIEFHAGSKWRFNCLDFYADIPF